MDRAFLALPSLIALAACAADRTAYPSLAPRAIERQGFAEPVVPVATVTPDPALDREIGDFGVRYDTIARGFAAAAAQAERKATAARGRAAGSDAWLDAQTALAALDDWRAQASALATDVEERAIGRAATLAPPYPALAALGDRTEAEVARQGAAIARLQAMLAPA